MEEGGGVSRPVDKLRRGIFSSILMVALLLIIITIFFFGFVVPSVRSFRAQIFRPNSFKKRWESLNMVLVLVASAFAFLSKIQNEDHRHEFQSSSSEQNDVHHISSSASSVVYDHGNSMLRRNSRSYPDLRDLSSNPWDYGIYRRRAFGDVRDTDPPQRHRRSRSMEAATSGKNRIITVPVTTPTPLPPLKINRFSPPPPPPAPPPGFNKPWKFVVQGDHVMIESPTTSESGFSDLDDVYSDATSATTSDVNSKAESFINDFRAKLKREKNHSIRNRQAGLSSLRPSQI